MKHIWLTGNYYALVDDQDYEDLNKFNWRHSKGYAIRTKRNGTYRITVRMHEDIYAKIDPNYHGEVDHKNRNGLDCQRDNLRPATRSQQNANRGTQRNNTSSFIGVSKEDAKWLAKINHDKSTHRIGRFNSAIEAAKAYDAKARELFGEFATLNFPD